MFAIFKIKKLKGKMFIIIISKQQLSEVKANKSYARLLHKKTEKDITERN